MNTNVYGLASDATPDQDNGTQDTVLAVLVGCVFGFYIVSICVVGCTRHSLRMQVAMPAEQKKRPKPGRGDPHDIDITSVLTTKSGNTNIEMRSMDQETAEVSEFSVPRTTKELL